MLWYYVNMAPIKSSPSKKARRFVLGRARLEKISAVEGIRTSAATRRMFAKFDAEGLTPAQRRKAILWLPAGRLPTAIERGEASCCRLQRVNGGRIIATGRRSHTSTWRVPSNDNAR